MKFSLTSMGSVAVIPPGFSGKKDIPFTFNREYLEFMVPRPRIYDVMGFKNRKILFIPMFMINGDENRTL